jgi:acyl-CoA thioester hydrolase
MSIYRTDVTVRMFDCDAQGHLSGANYLNYSSHALWSCLRSAGIDIDKLIADGLGPVHLETKIRFVREFRAGDGIDLSCRLIFDGGKVYRVRSEFRDRNDEVHAEVESVCGLLDLTSRRLHPDPASEWRKRCQHPEVLGLGEAR